MRYAHSSAIDFTPSFYDKISYLVGRLNTEEYAKFISMRQKIYDALLALDRKDIGEFLLLFHSNNQDEKEKQDKQKSHKEFFLNIYKKISNPYITLRPKIHFGRYKKNVLPFLSLLMFFLIILFIIFIILHS